MENKQFARFGVSVLILLGLIVLSHKSWAQTNCARILNEAENDYQRGNLYAIPDKLAACLLNGFEKEELIQAYRLLTLTYLNINQEDNAREALISLLKVNPEYKLGATTPVEFENLYNQINTDPYLYIGAMVNVGLSDVVVMRDFSMSSDNNQAKAEYTGKVSINLGLQVTVPIKKWLAITVQPNFAQVRYDYKEGINAQFQAEKAIQETTLTEQSRYWEFPVMARFNKEFNKLSVVAYAGGYVSSMISANFTEIQRINVFDDITNEVTGSGIDLTSYRRSLNFGYQAQLGIAFNYLGLNWETRLGIREQILNQAKYESVTSRLQNSFSYDYLYVDDDFRNRVFFFSLTVSKPFYNFYRAKK